MERVDAPLRLYGTPSDKPVLAWSWVDEQLRAAGTYWLTVPDVGRYPHPRPVWGVWHADHLHLSVGSPLVARALEPGTAVTAHLDSGTDVVIVEADVVGVTTDVELIRRYDAKYDWRYDIDEHGPLTTIQPRTVLAWRSAGWAGRDGFQQTGRWRYESA